MNGDTADGAMGRKSKDTCGIITYSFETVVGPPSLFHLAMQFSEMFRLLGLLLLFSADPQTKQNKKAILSFYRYYYDLSLGRYYPREN